MKIELLKSGHKVALIAPAKNVDAALVKPMVELLSSWGLQVCIGKHALQVTDVFSGTDNERAQDFIEAWQNPEIKAIFCARGGYGSMRILEHIPASVFKTNRKWLIGYSDITSLHLHLHTHNISSIHGPMAINAHSTNTFTQGNFQALHKTLFQGQVSINCAGLPQCNPGQFNGELIGGNLSLLYAALGTPDKPYTAGKVLFIEELDEYLYHYDRMIVSLDRAGLFKNLAALIIGSVIKMKDNKTRFGLNPQQIIEERCAKYGYPILFNFPAGHGAKNLSIIFGNNCIFDGIQFSQTIT